MRKLLFLSLMLIGCDYHTPVSSSGVEKTTVKLPTGPDGFTTEQRNVRERLLKDNEVGSIKHLYVISAYSGQTLIYSTVKGKVTSGGKRLTPSTIESGNLGLIPINIGNSIYFTKEILQDDGTYGSSMDYLFWFDTKGVYHQHYVMGGQIVHISSEPIAVKSITINMELSKEETNSPDIKEASTAKAVKRQ